jgi:glycerol-3-phosphate dehydrogenase
MWDRTGAPPSEYPPRLPMVRTDKAADRHVDVVVIGAGVNGTGVARDLAMRGAKVALFERNDIGFGASGNSSGMIHGGPRYLTQSPSVTESSCRDSGYIQQIAPFLLFRIPFLMPVKSGAKGRVFIELLDAFFDAYDKFQPLKRGKRHTRLSAAEALRLEPGLAGSLAGAVTFDEWGIDGGRLCVLNAKSAEQHGALIENHTSVEQITRGENYVVRTRHRLTGVERSIGTKVVVNATGAWAPLTAANCNVSPGRVRLRPGKGIHVAFDRRLSNYAIATEAVDGRQIFVEPWQNMTVIGTTDDDYYGSLEDVYATSEEVRYLVSGIARAFPLVRNARAIGTWAGVRPTLFEYGPNEDKLSREHLVVDHKPDGAPGIYSMIGGKLASYRIFAQELTDALAEEIAPSTQCRTHLVPLPGGAHIEDEKKLAADFEIDELAARRLIYRHGTGARDILRAADPKHVRPLCVCEPVLEAEVRHVVRHEWAKTPDDVSRRTRLGLGACGGLRCALACGQVLADELALSPEVARDQTSEFLVSLQRKRLSIIGPVQATQEAYNAAVLRATFGCSMPATRLHTFGGRGAE